MGGIIDHCQVLDAASFGRAVKDEVHGPYLVGRYWTLQGVTVSLRDLLAFTLPDLQSRFGIEPIDALVVDDLAGLAQLEVDQASPIAPVTLGQGDDRFLQRAVAVCSGFVPVSCLRDWFRV